MKQLMFIKSDTFEWHDMPTPKIADNGQALVRPLAVTRCDLDLYIATGLFPMQGPFAFGHEIAGEVIDIGDGVVSVRPGDRVIVPFQINCGNGPMCHRGFTNACEAVPPFSAYGLAPSSGTEWGGPLREYPAADVLIVGGLAQSVGLFAIKAAVMLGSKRVVYRDFDEARLAAARALGAEAIYTAYAADTRSEELSHVVVEAGGLPDAIKFALRSTAPCGICTSVSAGTSGLTEIPLRQMYMKGIRYEISRVHARSAIAELVRCDSCHSFRAGSLVDATVPFTDAAAAMGEGNIKTVFVSDLQE